MGLPRFLSTELYDAAADSVENKACAASFRAERDKVAQEAQKYGALAARGELGSLDPDAYTPSHVTAAELSGLYSRLRDNKAPRRLYNDLMLRAVANRCPYCSDREPETLDHYLPKAKFSALAVLATNLIPCCSTCNSKKGNFEASRQGTQAATLHPYFDDVSATSWLRARIVDSKGPVARLYVDGAHIPDAELRARAASHLRALNLKRYFKLKSAQEIAGLDETMPPLLRKSGRDAVVENLLSQAVQRSAGRLNSWERALYEGLAEDDWYLDEHLSALATLPSSDDDPRRPIAL